MQNSAAGWASRLTFTHKLLVTAGLVALMATLVSGGLAGFTAQVVNPGNSFSNATVTMTNVGGTGFTTGTDCATETYAGTCKSLTVSNLSPTTSAGAASAYVTLTYKGTLTTSTFNVTIANYSNTAADGTTCTASSPDAALKIEINQTDASNGNTYVVFPNAGGASSYGAANTLTTGNGSSGAAYALKGNSVAASGTPNGSVNVWHTNDSSRVNVLYFLDSSVATGNTYQGCKASFDLQFNAA